MTEPEDRVHRRPDNLTFGGKGDKIEKTTNRMHAQRLQTRNAYSPALSAMAGDSLNARIRRLRADHMPLAAAVQRRWLPHGANRHWPALLYAQRRSVLDSSQTLSTGMMAPLTAQTARGRWKRSRTTRSTLTPLSIIQADQVSENLQSRTRTDQRPGGDIELTETDVHPAAGHYQRHHRTTVQRQMIAMSGRTAFALSPRPDTARFMQSAQPPVTTMRTGQMSARSRATQWISGSPLTDASEAGDSLAVPGNVVMGAVDDYTPLVRLKPVPYAQRRLHRQSVGNGGQATLLSRGATAMSSRLSTAQDLDHGAIVAATAPASSSARAAVTPQAARRRTETLVSPMPLRSPVHDVEATPYRPSHFDTAAQPSSSQDMQTTQGSTGRLQSQIDAVTTTQDRARLPLARNLDADSRGRPQRSARRSLVSSAHHEPLIQANVARIRPKRAIIAASQPFTSIGISRGGKPQMLTTGRSADIRTSGGPGAVAAQTRGAILTTDDFLPLRRTRQQAESGKSNASGIPGLNAPTVSPYAAKYAPAVADIAFGQSNQTSHEQPASGVHPVPSLQSDTIQEQPIASGSVANPVEVVTSRDEVRRSSRHLPSGALQSLVNVSGRKGRTSVTADSHAVRRYAFPATRPAVLRRRRSASGINAWSLDMTLGQLGKSIAARPYGMLRGEMGQRSLPSQASSTATVLRPCSPATAARLPQGAGPPLSLAARTRNAAISIASMTSGPAAGMTMERSAVVSPEMMWHMGVDSSPRETAIVRRSLVVAYPSAGERAMLPINAAMIHGVSRLQKSSGTLISRIHGGKQAADLGSMRRQIMPRSVEHAG